MMKKLLMIAVLLGLAAALCKPLLAASNTFNVNFYMYPWPWTTSDQFETITLEPGQSSGFGDWLTDSWFNYDVPWAPTAPQDPVVLTSTQGATATFILNTCRNGGAYYWDAPRTTLLGDGNADMMDGHINSTEDSGLFSEMTFSEISLGIYDVIIYLGSQEAQFGDGTGKLVFNGGPEQDFTLISGEFDGTFTEIVDGTTPGNYIVFKKLTEPSFTLKVWGNGFNHIGPTAIQFGFIERMAPSPGYGETVLAANPLTLSWMNMTGNPDPADPNYALDVYVDVWWGTEPNALAPGGGDFNKIVTAESVDSTDVDSLAIDTYYWRVDSYLNGADDINEPNRLEGQLWTYTTSDDLAPSVEIVTLDQMTWAGEGVPLDATVTDDDESAVTIEWSADLPAGIAVAFDPGNGVDDTTVTFTKIPYANALIVNPGFEDPVLADGDSVLASGISGWTEGYYPAGTTNWAGWDELAGVVNPDAAYGYGGAAYAGENVGWCRTYPGYEQGLSQTLSEALAAETQYDLSVMVNTPELTTVVTSRIELLAGGTILATNGGIVTPNTWAPVSLTHTTGVSPAELGDPLTIRLFVGDAAFGFDVNFDDVVLTADPPFGLGGVQTVTMTVTVSDVANPTPDTASIEIAVYDDACHMAKVGQGRSAITDFNANCITGLEELVVMVAAWLDDYTATGPADRP